MAKSTTKRGENTTDDPDSDLKELRTVALGTVRGLLGIVQARLGALEDAAKGKDAASFDKDLTLAACTLAKTVVSIEAEARQQERAARQALSDLSLPKILGFLRTLTVAERRHVMRELERIDGGAGVLG